MKNLSDSNLIILNVVMISKSNLNLLVWTQFNP